MGPSSVSDSFYLDFTKTRVVGALHVGWRGSVDKDVAGYAVAVVPADEWHARLANASNVSALLSGWPGLQLSAPLTPQTRDAFVGVLLEHDREYVTLLTVWDQVGWQTLCPSHGCVLNTGLFLSRV